MKQIIFAGFLFLVFGISAFAQNEKLPCPTIEVRGGGIIHAGETMIFTADITSE